VIEARQKKKNIEDSKEGLKIMKTWKQFLVVVLAFLYWTTVNGFPHEGKNIFSNKVQ
jgi:hypothetical protein